jgi:parallel beta-helix repeat protein
MAGARQVLRGNCFKNNGQYGLNACCGDVTNLVLEGNEFVGNNADNVEAKYSEGCGCTGAMKFWEVNGADIRDNWIHDNRGPGIWVDTNGNDFLIERNLIENNDGEAIFYETSYNAVIRDNTIRRNNLVTGKGFVDRDDSFPSASVYLSESGGDPRVPARTDKIEFYDNVMEDNWSGITLWENADRFCNSPANSSTGTCTLVQKDVGKCAPPGIATKPLIDDCRWKTQRVDIHNNRFSINPQAIGCDSMCARMAVLSNYGSSPDWSPYQGDVVAQAITFGQDNRWHDNTYVGPWTFMPYDTTRLVEPADWQAGTYRQDQGSTFAGGN